MVYYDASYSIFDRLYNISTYVTKKLFQTLHGKRKDVLISVSKNSSTLVNAIIIHLGTDTKNLGVIPYFSLSVIAQYNIIYCIISTNTNGVEYST